MRNLNLFFLIALFMYVAIITKPHHPHRVHSSTTVKGVTSIQEAPIRFEQRHRGRARKGYVLINSRWKLVTYTDSNGVAILDGDIVLGTVEQLEMTRKKTQGIHPRKEAEINSALKSLIGIGPEHGKKWWGGIIHYNIETSMPNQSRVHDAIAHWEQNTPIRFVKRTNEGDFITFRRPPDNVCQSHVGRKNGQQFIDLADGCDRGSAIHEIGHAVGLWHEQSRSDRDGFVTIIYQNILPWAHHNFDFVRDKGQDVGAYDCVSIMHYDRYAFSANGQPTILPKNPNCNIGQRVRLSSGDIAGVSLNYNILGAHWQQIAGWGREIAIGANGSVYHIGQLKKGPGGNGVHKFNGTGWDPVEGVAARYIAVAPDGTLWHTNRMGDIYRGLERMPGKGFHIAIGANGSVYHIGQLKKGPGGNGVHKFNGTGWDPVEGVAAIRIAVAPDGTLWHINKMGDIYRGLEQIQGKAIDIAIGADGSVYHVGQGSMGPGGNAIYRWMGGNTWLLYSDAAAIRIAVDPQGRVWHLNRMEDIYRRM